MGIDNAAAVMQRAVFGRRVLRPTPRLHLLSRVLQPPPPTDTVFDNEWVLSQLHAQRHLYPSEEAFEEAEACIRRHRLDAAAVAVLDIHELFALGARSVGVRARLLATVDAARTAVHLIGPRNAAASALWRGSALAICGFVVVASLFVLAFLPFMTVSQSVSAASDSVHAAITDGDAGRTLNAFIADVAADAETAPTAHDAKSR